MAKQNVSRRGFRESYFLAPQASMQQRGALSHSIEPQFDPEKCSFVQGISSPVRILVRAFLVATVLQ